MFFELPPGSTSETEAHFCLQLRLWSNHLTFHSLHYLPGEANTVRAAEDEIFDGKMVTPVSPISPLSSARCFHLKYVTRVLPKTLQVVAHSSLPLTPHLQFEKKRPSYRGTGSGVSFAFRAPGRQRNSGPSPRAGVRGPEMLTAVQIIGTSPLLLIACLARRVFCLPGASHGPGVGSLSSCLGWGSCGGGGLPVPQPWSAQGLRGPLAVLCLGSPPPPRELPPGSGRVKGLPAPEDLGVPDLPAQHSMKPLIYTQDKCGKVLCPSAQTGLLDRQDGDQTPYR